MTCIHFLKHFHTFRKACLGKGFGFPRFPWCKGGRRLFIYAAVHTFSKRNFHTFHMVFLMKSHAFTRKNVWMWKTCHGNPDV